MVHFKAFVFDGRRTADKSLATIADLAPETSVWVDDVAVVSRGKLGFIRVNSTWAQDDDATAGGVGWGALTGGLVGALLGPEGALAGAVGGGAMGGLVGTSIDISVADPVLEEFANSLEKDTSAMVLVGEEVTMADFASAVEPYDATVFETNLNEGDVDALRRALKN